MNKERRKELYAVANKLSGLVTSEDDIGMEIDEIRGELEMILYDEESCMNNIPENLQGGYRYQMAEDACNNIECAIDSLDDRDVNAAIQYIYDAAI